jgi:DNA-binding NarL/FixJ family response regulator
MKVLVVSSHQLVGQSLLAMLGSLQASEPVEKHACLPSAVVQNAQEWKPDLIVVEAVTDFASRITTTREIRDVLPGVFIVVVGGENDDAAMYEAISAGADGYLPRDASPEEFIATLQGVARGELGLPRAAGLRVIRQLRKNLHKQQANGLHAATEPLTLREQEILDLVRAGMRSRDIASQLSIAEGTVYKHIHHILEKLRVHSRHQAAYAAEQGLTADATT